MRRGAWWRSSSAVDAPGSRPSAWRVCIEVQSARASACRAGAHVCVPADGAALAPVDVATRGEHRVLAWLERADAPNETFLMTAEDIWVI